MAAATANKKRTELKYENATIALTFNIKYVGTPEFILFN